MTVTDGPDYPTDPVESLSTPPLSGPIKLTLLLFGIAMMFSACVTIGGFWLYRNEVNARIAGQCAVITKTRNTLVGVVEFATKPADLTGLDPVRRSVVEKVNDERLQARRKYLPILETLNCRSSG